MSSSHCFQNVIIVPVHQTTLQDKDKKENFHKTLTRTVCALLNCAGGTLEVCNETASSNDVDSWFSLDNIFRPLEQIFQHAIGNSNVSSHFSSWRKSQTVLAFEVNALTASNGDAFVCTLTTNAYVPTSTQVLPVKGNEFRALKELLNCTRCVDITEFEKDGSKLKDFEFVRDTCVDFEESKILQFKCFKSSGKSASAKIINNGFTSYVSAFSNLVGGRILVGIEDKTRRVVGVAVNEKDRKGCHGDLIKKMKKMKWPDYCSSVNSEQPIDVKFHSVVNSDHSPYVCNGIQVYVIEITIHPRPGGVFVDTPESYTIVDNNGVKSVQALTFDEWKKMFFIQVSGERTISRTMSKCDWSQKKLKVICDELDGKLLRLINFGRWSDFLKEVELDLDKYESQRTEIELVLLSKWYVYHYRKGEFEEAEKKMIEFKKKSSSTKDNLIFEIRGLLCLSALQRTRGDFESSYETARDCLNKVDNISPCMLTAEFYVHFATMLTIVEGNADLKRKISNIDATQVSFKEDAMKFYQKALDHLKIIDYVPLSKVDMQQKSHINYAILKLGCSLSGDIVKHTVSKNDIEDANAHLIRYTEYVQNDANAPSHFRFCHHLFAMASLHYRQAQIESNRDKRDILLENAIRTAKTAQFSAGEYQFCELRIYAAKHAAVYERDLSALRNHAITTEQYTDKDQTKTN